MKRESKKRVWIDHTGAVIPAKYVPSIKKKEDKTVRQIHKKALKLHKMLKDFKDEAVKLADEMYKEMAMSNQIVLDDKPHNFTLFSFDKSIKIEIQVHNRIEFDSTIDFAQQKINEFLEEKTKGIDDELIVIIQSAFKTSRGKLDAKKIMQLFSLKINHPKWKEAMEILKNSMNVNHTKRYLNIYEKNEEGKYKMITLNYSAL